MSTTETLLRSQADRWRSIVTHPFVVATGEGTLPAETFDRWIVADHHFVVAFRRFVGHLVAIAPDEPARDLLAGVFGPLQAELELFRTYAAHRALDLAAEPGPVTLAYNAYLLALPSDGWSVAVTALFGAEKAYFDAWSAARAATNETSPFWTFVDNWSSSAFGVWVDDVAALVDRTVPATPEVAQVFETIVRYELRFWDAVTAGDPW